MYVRAYICVGGCGHGGGSDFWKAKQDSSVVDGGVTVVAEDQQGSGGGTSEMGGHTCMTGGLGEVVYHYVCKNSG